MKTKGSINKPTIWLSLSMALLTQLGACKSIHTELAMQATPAAVWAVISDNQSYPEWNPYHVRVDGSLTEGATLEVEIHKPNGNQLTIKPEVMRVRRNQELSWGGGIPGLFTGEHVFEIIQREHDILCIQREKFSGLFVLFAELDTIEEGYQQMNAALKARVENKP